MAIPVATLENSTKTLWLYRRNLSQAIEAGDKRLVASATGDLEMLAEHARYPSVREAALKTLQGPETTIQPTAVVSNIVSPASQDVVAPGADAATA